MIKKKFAAIAASALLLSSTGAIAQTSPAVSSLSVARSAEGASSLYGNRDAIVPASVFLIVIFAAVLLFGLDGGDGDDSPTSP